MVKPIGSGFKGYNVLNRVAISIRIRNTRYYTLGEWVIVKR